MDREQEAVSIDTTTQPFVGRWNRLISTTNWEKGRIIHEWREAAIESGASATEYSDQTWSELVDGVSGQHVGRLRRVYERFGSNYQDYEGLFWSHFQAAIDWDDAEMWLEGASQSKWSVSHMRRQRWESHGAVAEDEPQNSEIVAQEPDEDFEAESSETASSQERLVVSDSDHIAEARSPAGPDFGDEDNVDGDESTDRETGASIYAEDELGSAPYVRPFENLAELPSDLSEAFEAFKLAILRQKTDDWQQISCDDVLASLDALKELALAPSTDS
ncbi:MAG: hypothetical protein CMJ77_11420 [Planctomycetaceae bacterium]|nr:hypothetical protein [Planctomycetaceae bacterium]